MQTSQLCRFLLFVSLPGLAGCKKICGENLPQYTISTAERAWTDPFAVNSVWKFRNAAGYVRSYRVTDLTTEYVGSGGATKISFCPTYYEEYITANLVRTDSVEASKPFYRLELNAAAPPENRIPSDFLQWAAGYFYLPIPAVEAGQDTLRPATLRGRTYPAVMVRTGATYQLKVLHMYLTKAEGVVAFDDPRGDLWTRL